MKSMSLDVSENAGGICRGMQKAVDHTVWIVLFLQEIFG
jgi:hypothetical protein